MVGVPQNLDGSHNLTMPFSGMVCHPWARTCYHQPISEFEVTISTHYEDRKGDSKCQNGVVLGSQSHSMSLEIAPINRARMSSY